MNKIKKTLNSLSVRNLAEKLNVSVGTAWNIKNNKRELTISEIEKLLNIKNLLEKVLK